jgi:hypothetical protein
VVEPQQVLLVDVFRSEKRLATDGAYWAVALLPVAVRSKPMPSLPALA